MTLLAHFCGMFLAVLVTAFICKIKERPFSYCKGCDEQYWTHKLHLMHRKYN
jgi:hypothetical protein